MSNRVEPWLRGTLTEVDPVMRAVLHALELAGEDADRWATDLSDAEVHAQPGGLPSIAFHLQHSARSLDRLLTYAEGRQLNEAQLAQLSTEGVDASTSKQVLQEFRTGLANAMNRVRAFSPRALAEARAVGRRQLPTTVAGLLVHCADHAQRHAGQVVTTAKLLLAQRGGV